MAKNHRRSAANNRSAQAANQCAGKRAAMRDDKIATGGMQSETVIISVALLILVYRIHVVVSLRCTDSQVLMYHCDHTNDDVDVRRIKDQSCKLVMPTSYLPVNFVLASMMRSYRRCINKQQKLIQQQLNKIENCTAR